MPLGRAAPPVKGQYMNSTGGGLCSVISSTEGETQSLQVRKGGLDRDTTRAISLDDVNVDVTEIVRLPLEVASDIQRAANMAEEFSEEPENETATEMDELSAQFRTSRQELTNSLSTLTLSEMSWELVQRGPRRERRVDDNPAHAENCGRQRGGYYAVLGDIVIETNEDTNMAECRRSGVSEGADTWAREGTTSGKTKQACGGDDQESMRGEADDWNMHRRYFHQATWSSADRFRRTARCDELQTKLRSHLRQLYMDRQTARARFLRLLRHIFPGINLRKVPRWTRIRQELEKAWRAAKCRARGRTRSPPATGSHRGSRTFPTPVTLRQMATMVGAGLSHGCGCCLTCISTFLVGALALSMFLIAISVRLSTRWVDAALTLIRGLRSSVASESL